MGTGNFLITVPISGSGASVVISPVEGDGCIFTTLINSWLIGIFRIVGVSRSEHRADQAPFAGKIALDFETFGLRNHPVKDKEFGDLALIGSITTKVKFGWFAVGMTAYRFIAGYLELISPGISNV